MRTIAKTKWALFALTFIASCGGVAAQGEETVSFSSGHKVLQGLVYKPNGPGPFPAVLYNHGSAPGMLS
jgi:carboxymethylenebutenolidase